MFTKYEPNDASRNVYKRLDVFPSFVPRTDEERVQNIKWVLDEYRETKMYIGEKIDGSSGTFYLKDGYFGVCSRNYQIDEVEGNKNWEIVHRYNIQEKLKELGKDIAIQGELLGRGIQSNKYKLQRPDFFVFQVFDIEKQRYYDYPDFIKFCHDLGLKSVPIIDDNFILDKTIEEIITMADGESKLYSTPREGLVFRPLTEMWHTKLGRVSFKSISNKFLLKHDQ